MYVSHQIALDRPAFADNPWRDAASVLGRKIRGNVWTILFAALLCGNLMAAAKLFLPATFKASTQILIDPQDNRRFEIDAAPASFDANSAINYVESQMGVIGSERVLLRVIREQGMAGGAPVAEPASDGGQGGAEVRRGHEREEDKALLVLQKAVTITRAERSFLVTVTVGDKSPERAAALANAVVKAYGEINTIDRNAAARRLAVELNTRVETGRRELNEADSALQTYKITHNLVGVHDKVIVERRVTEASDSLAQAEYREILARARLKQLEAAPLGLGGVASFGPDPESRQLQVLVEGRATARAELENEESSLGDRHPAVVAGRARLRDFDHRIGLALDGLRRATRAQLAEAQGQAAAFQKKLADIAGELSKARESDSALGEMEENLEAKRKALTAVEARQRDANVMSRLEGGTFRIVSPARVPNVQTQSANLALWALFGALIGVALTLSWLAAQAIFKESGPTENAFRVEPAYAPGYAPLYAPAYAPAHASAQAPAHAPAYAPAHAPAGGPFLASLPIIAPAPGRSFLTAAAAMNETRKRRKSAYSLAVRDLLQRLARGAAHRSDAPLSLLIAATEPQAGASTLAVNLARAAAARGDRVLLIDAHHSHPALERLIPADGPKTLIELAGHYRPLYRLAPYAQSLSLLPATEDEEQVCQDIASERDYRSIAGVNGNFDLVIFDGPDATQIEALRDLFPAVSKIVLIAPDEASDPRSLQRLPGRLGLPEEKFAGFVRAASAPASPWHDIPPRPGENRG